MVDEWLEGEVQGDGTPRFEILEQRAVFVSSKRVDEGLY